MDEAFDREVDPSSMVCVYEATTETLAEIIAGALRAGGVAAEVQMGYFNGHGVPALARVIVRAADFEAAHDIIREYEG